MRLQHRQETVALNLADNCIYLARDGSLRSHAKTPEFFRDTGRNPELTDGRVLALHHVSTPQDVHYPTWETHPEGDELLILASGALAVEFREQDARRSVSLSPQAAFIVPAGIWHRIIVHELSVLIAITTRRNTQHQKA